MHINTISPKPGAKHKETYDNYWHWSNYFKDDF